MVMKKTTLMIMDMMRNIRMIEIPIFSSIIKLDLDDNK